MVHLAVFGIFKPLLVNEGVEMYASYISSFLNGSLLGNDFIVNKPASMLSPSQNAIVFLSRNNSEVIDLFNSINPLLCLTTNEISPFLNCSKILVNDPRLEFARVLSAFFSVQKGQGISEKAYIASGATIAYDVSIGPNCHIDSGVSIGQGTVVGSNVVILGQVAIGANCKIKSNTTIGEAGFGFVKDEKKVPISFPHLGGVTIGDNVEIGANCTVARAALDKTIIGNHVKTDDHVHIAHNCQIGEGTFIAAGAILSGSIIVGKDVWLSPNSTVIDQNTIGDGAFVGIGSVVTKPVQAKERVFGSPAKPIGFRRQKSR